MTKPVESTTHNSEVIEETQRLDYSQYLPTEIEHLTILEASIAKYALDQNLVELLKLHISQINGCSFCVSYHSQKLRRCGESDERIDLVAVYQESPCFTHQEKVALRWAEAVTQLSVRPNIGDSLYSETLNEFGEEKLSQLTFVIALINVWNRLAVPFQTDHKYISELLKPTL